MHRIAAYLSGIAAAQAWELLATSLANTRERRAAADIVAGAVKRAGALYDAEVTLPLRRACAGWAWLAKASDAEIGTEWAGLPDDPGSRRRSWGSEYDDIRKLPGTPV